MKKNAIKLSFHSFKFFYFLPVAYLILINCSCSKQQIAFQNDVGNDIALQTTFLNNILSNLKDSVSLKDYVSIDSNKIFKSKDYNSSKYFVRIGFKEKTLAEDFILLKTDSIGNINQGVIVHVTKSQISANKSKFAVEKSSLNRKKKIHTSAMLRTTFHSSNNPAMQSSSSGAHTLMVEETTLPDVVVTCVEYGQPAEDDYYSLDDMMYMGGGGYSGTAGGTYTYAPAGGGGHGPEVEPVHQDPVINITYEDADQAAIDIAKYLKCFSLLSNQGATFKITIYSDIPVNGDPSKLFDVNTGACGHTFLQLVKSNGTSGIQQNIGFYPSSGWKSIESNSPVSSKLVDNAGHEFNASLTVSVDATQFQSALNEIQYKSTMKYDIDNFNCTDFALDVFNSAAPILLDIPQYHIPGGMYGELSNTPQGLYNELLSLNKTKQYPGAEITIPGVAGYTGGSHGACN